MAGFLSTLTKKDKFVILLLIISIIFLIVGIVFLAIGISAANNPPPCPAQPTTSPLQPTALFTSSYTSTISWDDNLKNSNSDLFKSTAQTVQQNIISALTPESSKIFTNLATETPLTVTVNTFQQATNGVNFFTTILFSDGNVDLNDLQTALNAVNYQTNAFANPNSQCSALIPPSTTSSTTSSGTASTVTVPVVTTVTTPTKAPVNQGAYCDASSNKLINIYLVDVAVPTIGTLDQKLAQVQQLLTTAPGAINLANNSAWNNVEFRLVAYGGNEPIPLGRARNVNEWQLAVNLLNASTVNPQLSDRHSLAKGLRFVFDNYQAQTGVASNLIIISDGFDFLETDAQSYSSKLQAQYYSIGTIVASQSDLTKSSHQSIVSDFSHFYAIDTIDYIQNTAVVQTQAKWACNAFYPTTPSPTAAPTRIPLVTTAGPSTASPTARPTLGPNTPPVSQCNLNVLFLIDESQSVVATGYQTALDYAAKLSTSLNSINSNNTYSLITFNSDIRFTSQHYQNLTDFLVTLKSTNIVIGTSDYKKGFDNATNFISGHAQYSNDNYRSVLVFISDGIDTDANANIILNSATQLRSTYQTQILGVDLLEDSASSALLKKAIAFNTTDGYIQSAYVGVKTPTDVLADGIISNSVNSLQCKDTSDCSIDLTFVIEVSQIEGSNLVEVQKRTVNNIITHYANTISDFKNSVSLIFFSSPDDLTPGQSGMSGILYQQVTNANNAIEALIDKSFSPLGGASDLQLGFQYTAQSLNDAFTQNTKFVVFIARGSYENYTNCCADPSTDAANVRKQAIVQGVVLGPYPNKNQLDILTGSNSIDGNQIINNIDLQTETGKNQAASALAASIIPTIDNFISTQYCSSIPDYVTPPCQEPIDVQILFHASSQDNWNLITNFTASQIVPDLLGYPLSTSPLTVSKPVNLAIITYTNLATYTIADFEYLLSPRGYVVALQSAKYIPTVGTTTLSNAYNQAVKVFAKGRSFASKNLIVITDTVDHADVTSAQTAHDHLVLAVGGFTSALTINANEVPGKDWSINVSPAQIGPQNQYSRRQISNFLSTKTCNYKPLVVPTTAAPTPAPTLPGDIPLVKARNVWPDVTILIDTSTGDNTTDTMDAIAFEKVRHFLDILLSQYSVGLGGSRFTIATFDGTTTELSCTFSQTNNYYDLSTCRNEQLSLYSRSHSSTRNLNNAFKYLLDNVFVTSSGYRPLNENFLYIFTLGQSTEAFDNNLINIQRRGVRTVAVGLSSKLTNAQISAFAPTSYLVPNWLSATNGIDTNTDLADALLLTSTNKRQPSVSSFYANIYVLVDQSASIANDSANVAQFVKNLIRPFSVDKQKTQISIVPYADDVLNPLKLTSNQSAVDSYLDSWSAQASTSSLSDINKVIQNIAGQLSSNNDRPSYVIYVIGSRTADNYGRALSILNSNVSGWVVQYTNAIYTGSLVTSAANIFTVPNSAGLLDHVGNINGPANPALDFMTAIFSAQEATDSVTYPLTAVVTDIVVLVDETGLNTTDFEIVKQYISDFTTKFTVAPTATQFALQAYNGRTIAREGFHFKDITNGDDLRQRISQLRLETALENSTDADVGGAVEEALNYFLVTNQGWRDDTTTYTVILSHADRFYKKDTSAALGIRNISKVSAIGYNGQKYSDVQQFVNADYETVNNVYSLKIDSAASMNILTTIDNEYKQLIYPSPVDLRNLNNADFIFLVDTATSRSNIDSIRAWLESFVDTIGPFSQDGSACHFALIPYDSNGISSSAMNFKSDQKSSSIHLAIANLYATPVNGNSNLRIAIESFLLDGAKFGVSSDRQTYVTLLATSPSISQDIDSWTSRNLNTRYSTFAIQSQESSSPFSYISQFLNSKRTDRFVYDKDVIYADSEFVPYKKWIQSEYSAWTTTYPQ